MRRMECLLDKQAIDQWITVLLDKLKMGFGKRLKLVVLVGSQAREDANPKSDIDFNVVLDEVTLEDIAQYRDIVESQPHKQLACGFLGGMSEMALWPRYDLVSFHYGSRVLHGSLLEVIGQVTEKDVYDNALITLTTINHGIRHGIIYGSNRVLTAHKAYGLYKAAFFVIQYWYVLKFGEYIGKKGILLKKSLNNEDRAILDTLEHWDDYQEQRELKPMQTLEILERWSSTMFGRLVELRPL